MFNTIKSLLSSPQISIKNDFKILIFCGAGISAESGLNTFRDSDGLWNNYDVNEICNIRNFIRNKEKVFNFYNDRKKEILTSEPNQAHYDLAKLQKKYGSDKVIIYTSNIDNLLEKAGCNNVCHVHGDISTLKCLDCSHSWSIGNNPYDLSHTCKSCNSSNIKPGIVFFGEKAEKYTQLLNDFNVKSYRDENLIPTYKLIIGTSLTVLNPSFFNLTNGESILVDLNKNKYDNLFDVVINEKASIGVKSSIKLIENSINLKNNI